MSTPAAVLANWTALCGSDADTIISDLVPLLQLLGNTYIAYRMLADADRVPIQEVDPKKLIFVRELCVEVASMIENNLRAIRYIPPQPVIPEPDPTPEVPPV